MVSFSNVFAAPALVLAQADAIQSGFPLMDALLRAVASLWDVLFELLLVIVPWSPLIAWVAFWLFAVRWVRLREIMAKGGWVGVVLLGAVAVMVWGSVS